MSGERARGSKPHKNVWVSYLTIPHSSGFEERYVPNVFASRDAAVSHAREWLDPHHGQPRVTLDEDSAYLKWPSGNTMRINRYSVLV